MLANHTRLIAHGSCALNANDCNGLHLASRGLASPPLGGNPIVERLLCQKHSDDGGKTWSQLRVVSRASQNGQIVWDDVHKVLIAMWTPGVAGVPLQESCTAPASLTDGKHSVTLALPPQEHRSYDLGETWSAPRNMSALFSEGPSGNEPRGPSPHKRMHGRHDTTQGAAPAPTLTLLIPDPTSALRRPLRVLLGLRGVGSAALPD